MPKIEDVFGGPQVILRRLVSYGIVYIVDLTTMMIRQTSDPKLPEASMLTVHTTACAIVLQRTFVSGGQFGTSMFSLLVI